MWPIVQQAQYHKYLKVICITNHSFVHYHSLFIFKAKKRSLLVVPQKYGSRKKHGQWIIRMKGVGDWCKCTTTILQRLPKLAVVAWSYLVVVSKTVYIECSGKIGAKVFVGAHLSFRSHQFIYSVIE